MHLFPVPKYKLLVCHMAVAEKAAKHFKSISYSSFKHQQISTMKGIPLQWNEGGGGIRPSPKSSWNIDLSAEVFKS